ncbi:MAG: HNH endonuclease [Pikeienuella sp.]|uniref:HNH endonuclease n=1 Tax=Pikeienuella sp. TaxID=2831957 RepID=UPI0039191DA5
MVFTDLYARSCAVTQEPTLPALEAAHIRPDAEGGAHGPSNGVLQRREMHSLFDAGYVTITPSLRLEVSPRIREEFDNGTHYFALRGREIDQPTDARWRPDPKALRWHNDKRFNG